MGTLLNWSVAVQAEESFVVAQKKETPAPGPTPMPLPKFYARHVAEGNKLLAQGKLQEAMTEFVVAKNINPDYYPLYIGMGNVYRKTGNTKQAVSHYQQAIRLLNPIYGQAYKKKGDYYSSKGRYSEALVAYWDLLRIDPQAGNQLTLAMKLLKLNKEKDAIKAFETAARIDADYPDPHFLLGNLYYTKNDLKKAIPAYEKAASISSNNPRYHYFLANAYFKNSQAKKQVDQGQLNNAIDSYERAVSLGIYEKNLHFNLGTAYLMQKSFDPSILNFEKAIKMGTNDDEVFYNLGNALYGKAMAIPFTWDGRRSLTDPYKLKQNDTKFALLWRSIKSYEIAVFKNRSYDRAYFDLGVAYYRLSELKPTAQFLSRLITKETAKDYYSKGIGNFKLDISGRAIANFEKFMSLRLNPTDKERRAAGEIIVDIKKTIGAFGG